MDDPGEDTSRTVDESHNFVVSIPEDVDLESLSDLLPGISLTSPSPEAIIALYRLLLVQALEGRSITQELDETRAEVEKKDVELDQALQDRESMSRELETSLESVHSQFNQMKDERDKLAASHSALQDQVTALTNSQSSSSSEVDALKHHVEDTEREKRDLVRVISRLKQEGTQQEEEIQTLRSNLKEARHEYQTLEVQVRELRSTETSTKFKLDTLTQQLQLAQAEVERTNTELNSKSEEFSKYRRTKHSELANVQVAYDSLNQSHASTQATLKTLQSAHVAQSHQLTQALARVQDLTGQLAEQEATYASEASGLRRLVGMMEEREKQAKEIVGEIEKEWAGVGERSERREAALREDVERERKARENAEKRAIQLESVLDRMGRGELPILGRATPGTPSRTPGVQDLMTEAMIGLSPTVAMASKAQRSGKTFTEVYADYVRLQEDYAKKSAEYDHMDRTLSAVLAQIEERAPILSQQRAEYERLQSEASQLASQLAQALSDRDAHANLAQDTFQKLTKSVRENELLQRQLEDLGRQVQSLLREIGRRDDPTIPSDEELDAVHVTPAEDTEAVITNNLVLFKSIGDLQEQNQKLLKIVRELGRKMENEEREYREAMEKEQDEAIKEAHEVIQDLSAQLERQKKSSDGVIQAYMKERDALRGMLARAEKAGEGAAKVNGIGAQYVELSGLSSDTAKELAEIQSQFEAYRMEMGIDTGKLREDLAAAQREVGQAGASLAKANAKIEFLSDRHRMTQEQLAMRGRELDELTKRNQQLFDQLTRVDIECSRATEDLHIATSRTEQLRNECANLRAEKKIWESVQVRLVEENKTLALERSHISDLMVNVQKMHNDLERSGENDRRRLENQLQMLEGQTQDLRTQLMQERDNVRHISLQKDIELKELHSRMDKATQELSKTRESLVGAETSKKHLEERIIELTKQLQGNEEKLAVYERRSSTVSGITQVVDQDMSREQQLEAEVAELRSALKVTEVDLATARSHVQQFKEISQANEEALSNLKSTYDDYKTSTEAQLAHHESEHQALQEKLQTAQDELTQLTTKYNELQKSFETERIVWTNDKKTLEDTIVDMSTSEKNSENDRTSRENEVRHQEERAKAAEERYSNEVLAHAESIKSIDNLKRDLATVQASARDGLTAAETAAAKLSASEDSWKQQKAALDKEVTDLNARCQDLSSQNTILHQHLESVSSQANRIKAAAQSSSTVQGEGDTTEDADTKLSELRSVVAYLRKEKEIVDLQLELSKQETTRLKTQIEHLSQTLQDTRATLSEERERAAESAASAAQHAELLERINQLNILRESNATLRGDCQSYSKKARELEAKLKQLSQELEPAKEQARISQAELEASKAQLSRLEDESRKWQERNSQLLSKYDRIDPAEVQSLKDEIEALNAQKAEIERQKVELQQADSDRQAVVESHTAKIAALEENLQQSKEIISRQNATNKSRIQAGNAKITSLVADKRALEAKVASLEQSIAELQASTGNASTTNVPSEGAEKQASIITALQEERDKLLAEKASWTNRVPSEGATAVTEDAIRVWEAEKGELVKARDNALAEAKTAKEDHQKALEEAKEFKRSSEKFQARVNNMMKAKVAEDERLAAEKSNNQQGAAVTAQAELVKRHAEELHSLETKLTAKHQEELKAAVEKAQQEKPAPDAGGDQNIQADQKAAIEVAIAELQARHAEEISAAVERGRMESAAKGKLKDSQLVRAQKRVRELEAQILGLLPGGSGSAAGSAAGPSTDLSVSTTPVIASNPAQSATSPLVSNLNPTSDASATASTSLPRKPSVANAPPTGPARGVVRGAVRGRGVQRVLGGAVGLGRAAPQKPGETPSTSGMQIMGAATKRPLDDSLSEDSLAKRLKPAEPAAKPPVQIRRPPSGAPPPQ